MLLLQIVLWRETIKNPYMRQGICHTWLPRYLLPHLCSRCVFLKSVVDGCFKCFTTFTISVMDFFPYKISMWVFSAMLSFIIFVFHHCLAAWKYYLNDATLQRNEKKRSTLIWSILPYHILHSTRYDRKGGCYMRYDSRRHRSEGEIHQK